MYFTSAKRRAFEHSAAILVRVPRALDGTLVVVDPRRAVVRRMSVSAKTRVPVGQMEIFVARRLTVLRAHVGRVVRQFDGTYFLVRVLVTS